MKTALSGKHENKGGVTLKKGNWQELPSGLLARTGHNTRAMETFFSYDAEERRAILENIQNAPTGEEAKAQIEYTLHALELGNI